MTVALLTGDTPRWLFLVLVALVAAAYIACAVLALTARARRASAQRRRHTHRPVSAAVTAGVRQEVTS